MTPFDRNITPPSESVLPLVIPHTGVVSHGHVIRVVNFDPRAAIRIGEIILYQNLRRIDDPVPLSGPRIVYNYPVAIRSDSNQIVIEIADVGRNDGVKAGIYIGSLRFVNRNTATLIRCIERTAIYNIVPDNPIISMVQLDPAATAIMHQIARNISMTAAVPYDTGVA